MITRLVNVAFPVESELMVRVPLAKEPLLKDSVIGTLFEATLFPLASWICTTTLLIVVPAVVFVGCVVNASFEATRRGLSAIKMPPLRSPADSVADPAPVAPVVAFVRHAAPTDAVVL